jgi:alkyl hydroperoxide reductase subunit AhpF
MPTQNIQQEMMQHFMQLNEAEKKSVLQMIKTFLKGRKEKSGRISIEQYNREIDEAMKRMDAGEFYTHEEVTKMSKSWANGK